MMGWEVWTLLAVFREHPKAESARSRLQTGAHSQVNSMPFHSQLDDRLKHKVW